MSELAKRLGRRIYDFRKQSGLTQAALAEKAKISNEFMSAVERGAKLLVAGAGKDRWRPASRPEGPCSTSTARPIENWNRCLGKYGTSPRFCRGFPQSGNVR